MKPEEIEAIKAFDAIFNAAMAWRWIPVKEMLPPMFTNVLTNGEDEKGSIHVVARRFTGWSSGWEGIKEKREAPWHWITESDRQVKNVRFWMPLPLFCLPAFRWEFDRKGCVKPEKYSLEFEELLTKSEKTLGK